MRAGRTEKSWTWAVPPSSFVTGSEVVKNTLMLGYALMDLSAPGAPVLLSNGNGMISVHSAREAAALEGEGGSKKRKKNGGKARARAPKDIKIHAHSKRHVFYMYLCTFLPLGVCCARVGP